MGVFQDFYHIIDNFFQRPHISTSNKPLSHVASILLPLFLNNLCQFSRGRTNCLHSCLYWQNALFAFAVVQSLSHIQVFATPWTAALSWRRGLCSSMKLWAMPCRATQDRQVMVESSDKTWSEEGMATHSSILAWRIPWTEEPGGLHTVHGVAKSQTRLSN